MQRAARRRQRPDPRGHLRPRPRPTPYLPPPPPTPSPPRAPLSARAAALAGLLSGCAAAPEVAWAPAPEAQVRIDGLEFLVLNGTRDHAIAGMRRRDYLCLDEASTGRNLPCTSLRPRSGPSQVVLGFAGERLDRVWAALTVAGDPRDAFESTYDVVQQRVPKSWVRYEDAMSVAYLLPGDGSRLEVRHLLDAGVLDIVHLAPRPRRSASQGRAATTIAAAR